MSENEPRVLPPVPADIRKMFPLQDRNGKSVDKVRSRKKAGNPYCNQPDDPRYPGVRKGDVSRNPNGKAPGTRNRSTLLREELETCGAERAKAIFEMQLAKAERGDLPAARFVFDLMFPKDRRAVRFPFAVPTDPEDAPAATWQLLSAVSNGDLSPDEAEKVARVHEQHLTALKIRAIALHARERDEDDHE
jgi:hypothetical protein